MATEAFISEIQIFAFPFAPKYWAQCNGQVLPISQNQALFSLIGTMYGGNGTTTFNLPDFRSRTPIHFGTSPGGANYAQGQVGGEENHTLTIGEMPAHTHQMMASSNNADNASPVGNLLAKNGNAALFVTAQNNTQMAGNEIALAGGGLPHPNLQPYLTLNYCICLSGIFPSRN